MPITTPSSGAQRLPVTIWRVRDRQIDDYRIYIDVAPLFTH
jgi:hypothetical protein